MFDYGFRIYDPRLGRFLSVDPLTASYPWYTPYQFSSNTPIQSIDLDGLESSPVTELMDGFKEMYRTVITPKSYIDLLDGFQKFHEINKEKGGAYDLVGVTDAKVALTGTDWQGQKQNRAIAAGLTVMSVFPIEKLGAYGLKVSGFFWAKNADNIFYFYQKVVTKVSPQFIGASERVLANAIGAKTGALRQALITVGHKFEKGEQAHHIIPYELLEKFKVFRDAVDKGFDFNGVINGIPLDKIFHSQATGAFGHPEYTNQIRKFVGGWFEKINDAGNYTPEKALDLMNQIAGSVKSQIEAAKASGLQHLDDIKLDFSTIVQPK